MRFFRSSPPRILLGLLTVLFLIFGSLMLARHILLENSGDPPPSQRPSTTHPGPPVLPGVMVPQPSDKAGPKPSPTNDPSAPSSKVPTDIEAAPSLLMEPSPSQVRVRVLPPIQSEPDDDEVVEWAPDVEPEPIGDETAEETTLPPMSPEQSPDFVR